MGVVKLVSVGSPVLEIEYRGYCGRTKKFNSRRSLGDQTTWGTKKIQEAQRGQKWNIHIEMDKNFD